jgi:hypothetical protein
MSLSTVMMVESAVTEPPGGVGVMEPLMPFHNASLRVSAIVIPEQDRQETSSTRI